MAAPAYDTITFSTPTKAVSATAALAQTFEGLNLPNDSWALPSIPGLTLTSGTGAGNFNALTKLYTATATGNTDYDLTALEDPLGNAVNFDNIRYFFVLNYAVTAGYVLKIDGTVTNAWLTPFDGIATAKLVIPPGWTNAAGVIVPGELKLGGGSAAGMVTSGTSKVLRIAAGANTIAHAFFAVGVDS